MTGSDDLFLGGISMFGDRLNEEYDMTGSDLTLLKIESNTYDAYRNLDGVAIIAKKAGYKSSIDTLTITSSVTRINTQAFLSTGIKNIVIEDGEKGLYLERHALDLQNVTEFVCPGRLENFGEQYYGFKPKMLANSKFIGGSRLQDFDLKALAHFQSIDLSMVDEVKLSWRNRQFLLEECELAEAPKVLLLSTKLLGNLDSHMHSLLDIVKEKAKELYGEGNYNFSF